MKLFLILIFTSFLFRCTSVGVHHTSIRDSINFGKKISLNLCIYKDNNLSENRIQELIKDWQNELNLYSIQINIAQIKNWKREHFFFSAELEDLLSIPLNEPCDRMLLFLSTNILDSLFDLLPLGTILGAVEGYTSTKGYIIADYFSIEQIFSTPSDTLLHEGYHLFGCEHSITLSNCYYRILSIKNNYYKISNKEDFIPAINFRGELFLNRKSVNKKIRDRNQEHP